LYLCSRQRSSLFILISLRVAPETVPAARARMVAPSRVQRRMPATGNYFRRRLDRCCSEARSNTCSSKCSRNSSKQTELTLRSACFMALWSSGCRAHNPSTSVFHLDKSFCLCGNSLTDFWNTSSHFGPSNAFAFSMVDLLLQHAPFAAGTRAATGMKPTFSKIMSHTGRFDSSSLIRASGRKNF